MPVPVPGPVAVNTVPAVLLAAPINVKSVLPANPIVYSVPVTNEPAVTVVSVLFPNDVIVYSVPGINDTIFVGLILCVKPIAVASNSVGKVMFNSNPSIFVNISLLPFEFKVTSTFAALIAALVCSVVNNADADTPVTLIVSPSTVNSEVIEVRFGIKFGETSSVGLFLYCVKSSPKLNVAVLVLKTIV